MKNTSAFTQPTPESVATRLRTIRKSRGWTLHDIENRTGGSIKAVVMGSYERGTRAISLARALELANLFAIPISELLSEPSLRNDETPRFRRFDQRRIGKLLSENEDERLGKLNNFLVAIAQRRGDNLDIRDESEPIESMVKGRKYRLWLALNRQAIFYRCDSS
jgi:transcriptional regulator with XRE-family HTH domain